MFNFYEPLHYFVHNSGFQTWELSPQYAVRSWAYILLHYPLAILIPRFASMGKRQQFFALRLFFGLISTLCEASFYRAIVVAVNERVGRYALFGLLLSAGMWNASVCESSRYHYLPAPNSADPSVPPLVVCNVRQHARCVVLVPPRDVDQDWYPPCVFGDGIHRRRCHPRLAFRSCPWRPLRVRVPLPLWW